MNVPVKGNTTPVLDINDQIIDYDVHVEAKCSHCGYEGKPEVAWGSSLLQCPKCSCCNLTPIARE